MAEQVVIERRFRGPEESGNGGYACGALARFVDAGSAEVTLRLPPPLDRSLEVEEVDGNGVEMREGNALIAEARPLGELGLDLDIPAPLSVALDRRRVAPR